MSAPRCTMVPIARSANPLQMEAEVSALSDDERLLERGSLLVAAARADRIPTLLREIGRLREQSFRAIGEGTGCSEDLDAFDERYTHLFVWNRETSEVVGAYRFARTDEVLRTFGPSGLYTQSLFSCDDAFFDRLGPALELGRSFVRIEYQRVSQALLLLWKGIGRIVCREPRFVRLFGPVSISAAYPAAARELMVTALQSDYEDPALSPLVRPRNPVASTPQAQHLIDFHREVRGNLDALSKLVSELDPEERGLPTLVREYLRLGGRFAAFNLDPAFSNAIDGLVIVDLRQANERLLAFHMGKREARIYLANHDALAA